MKAYLQNRKAQYYCLGEQGRVELCAEKKALQIIPEAIEPDENTIHFKKNEQQFIQTTFSFRNDGCRILSHLFFTRGTAADCILTLEDESNICGNLDFTTARIYKNKEIRINCLHF